MSGCDAGGPRMSDGVVKHTTALRYSGQLQLLQRKQGAVHPCINGRPILFVHVHPIGSASGPKAGQAFLNCTPARAIVHV